MKTSVSRAAALLPSCVRILFSRVLWLFLFSLFFFPGHATQHVGSSFPAQGLNSCPLQWKSSVLTTGLPGKTNNSLLTLPLALHPQNGKGDLIITLCCWFQCVRDSLEPEGHPVGWDSPLLHFTVRRLSQSWTLPS